MRIVDRDSRRDAGPTVGLLALIGLALAVLWSLDVFLARTEQDAVQAEAARMYDQGKAALQSGNAAEAVDDLRRASSLVRDNRAYQLDYAQALISAGKLDEADTNLKTLLQADPNNGQANLLAARLMVKQGKAADAESHYHRAIYGSWPENAPKHRLQVRMELANFLVSRGEQQELLAELLALDNESQASVPMRKQIAHLYLVAGSPGRAAGVYRDLVRRDPDDAASYVGLGEVEMAQGDYHSALSAFLDASRRNSDDPTVQNAIERCNAVIALDPTPRRLSSAEKFARSTQILKLARDALDRCLGNHAAGNVDDMRKMVDASDKMLAEKTPAHVTNELSEARLTFAEQLWQARVKACGPNTSDQEEALSLIMMKLARS